jgi:hypothetical protein
MDRIDQVCEEYGISGYRIRPDGSIDVDGDVRLEDKGLTELPLRFNYVMYNFVCEGNKLTSLIGCPKEVGYGFFCNYNELTSLEGCPSKVGGDFLCFGNKLTTLNDLPTKIGNRFDCSDNKFPEIYMDMLNDAFPMDWGEDGEASDDLKVFFQYQHYYDIWTPDFNIDGMNDLIAEIKDGLE